MGNEIQKLHDISWKTKFIIYFLINVEYEFTLKSALIYSIQRYKNFLYLALTEIDDMYWRQCTITSDNYSLVATLMMHTVLDYHNSMSTIIVQCSYTSFIIFTQEFLENIEKMFD